MFQYTPRHDIPMIPFMDSVCKFLPFNLRKKIFKIEMKLDSVTFDVAQRAQFISNGFVGTPAEIDKFMNMPERAIYGNNMRNKAIFNYIVMNPLDVKITLAMITHDNIYTFLIEVENRKIHNDAYNMLVAACILTGKHRIILYEDVFKLIQTGAVGPQRSRYYGIEWRPL
jgi:hypothetical protein